MSKDIIKIRLDLEGDNKEMFEAIRQKYNLERNTETMRLIIKIAYDKEFENKTD